MDEALRPTLLIVDDDEAIRTQMKWAFVEDYEVMLARDRASALELVRTRRPSLVALDLGLPPNPHRLTEGLEALRSILALDPFCPVIVITGQGEREAASAAVADGAYDFLDKPIDLEELKIIVRRALYLRSIETENAERLRGIEGGPIEELLGASPRMADVFRAIRKVSGHDAPVVIVGETGTGKELVARAIHRTGRPDPGPFVAINCGAIPENLLESELFGHEKGAFTDAHLRRKGRLEMAQSGTLFLDEVAELPLPLQVKILRYLQDHVIQRVGGREDIFVDARIVAATNVDLERAVREQRLREDLYYRLNVVRIVLPPLRERGDDVIRLAMAFLHRSATGAGKAVTGFTQPALSAMARHPWPGNVRELENRVTRAVIMCDRRRITPEDLELDAPSRAGLTLREAREEVEREMVRSTLSRNRGNVTRTAANLGISRPTLYELMSRYGIER